MGGFDVDLRRLLLLVSRMGGVEAVTKNKCWRQIGRELNVPLSTSSSTALRLLFNNLVSPFAAAVVRADDKAARLADMGLPEDLAVHDGGTLAAAGKVGKGNNASRAVGNTPLPPRGATARVGVAPAPTRTVLRRAAANGAAAAVAAAAPDSPPRMAPRMASAQARAAPAGGRDIPSSALSAAASVLALVRDSAKAKAKFAPEIPRAASPQPAVEDEPDTDSDCEIFEPTGDSLQDALTWVKRVAAGGPRTAGGAAARECKETLLQLRVARSVVRSSVRSRRPTSAYWEVRQSLASLNGHSFLWPRIGPEFQALRLPEAKPMEAAGADADGAGAASVRFLGERVDVGVPKAPAALGKQLGPRGALLAPSAIAPTARRQQHDAAASAADLAKGAPRGIDIGRMPTFEQRLRACRAASAALRAELGVASEAMGAIVTPLTQLLSATEAAAFEDALKRHGKNFGSIGEALPGRCHAEVVQHYFNEWKPAARAAKLAAKAAREVDPPDVAILKALVNPHHHQPAAPVMLSPPKPPRAEPKKMFMSSPSRGPMAAAIEELLDDNDGGA